MFLLIFLVVIILQKFNSYLYIPSLEKRHFISLQNAEGYTLYFPFQKLIHVKVSKYSHVFTYDVFPVLFVVAAMQRL